MYRLPRQVKAHGSLRIAPLRIPVNEAVQIDRAVESRRYGVTGKTPAIVGIWPAARRQHEFFIVAVLFGMYVRSLSGAGARRTEFFIFASRH